MSALFLKVRQQQINRAHISHCLPTDASSTRSTPSLSSLPFPSPTTLPEDQLSRLGHSQFFAAANYSAGDVVVDFHKFAINRPDAHPSRSDRLHFGIESGANDAMVGAIVYIMDAFSTEGGGEPTHEEVT
jgi:hypothetical protein